MVIQMFFQKYLMWRSLNNQYVYYAPLTYHLLFSLLKSDKDWKLLLKNIRQNAPMASEHSAQMQIPPNVIIHMFNYGCGTS